MAKSLVEKKANKDEIKSMIAILEQVGKPLQAKTVEQIRAQLALPVKDREMLVRILLLLAILDQQAESQTAREMAIQIYNIFGADLFQKPQSIIMQLHKLAPIADDYKVSPAIGRVLPRFGWIVLRVGGFLIYEMVLNKIMLLSEFAKCATPQEGVYFLYKSPILKSILRDKAANMYISWIGHPNLGIDVSNGKWEKKDFSMPINGHVGKIFSRSGILTEVIHERLKYKSDRWNIIEASKMREPIQKVASKYSSDVVLQHPHSIILS